MERPHEAPPAAARGRAWTPVTTWASAGAAALAAAALIALAYLGPSYAITEADFTGSRVFLGRLVGGVLMVVLLASCLLQAGLLLPQRSARRPGLGPAAVLDLLLIAGILLEVALVLSLGFQDEPDLDLAILATGAGLALLAVVRFVVIVTSGIREVADRRRDARSAQAA